MFNDTVFLKKVSCLKYSGDHDFVIFTFHFILLKFLVLEIILLGTHILSCAFILFFQIKANSTL